MICREGHCHFSIERESSGEASAGVVVADKDAMARKWGNCQKKRIAQRHCFGGQGVWTA